LGKLKILPKVTEIANSDLYKESDALNNLFWLGFSIMCLFDFDKSAGDQTNHTENSMQILE
jgi:hypothetical protein